MPPVTTLLFMASAWAWLLALLWLNNSAFIIHGWVPQALLWPLLGLFLSLGQMGGRNLLTLLQVFTTARSTHNDRKLAHSSLSLLQRNLLGAGMLGSALLLVYHLGYQETVPQLATGLQQALQPLLYGLLLHLSISMPLNMLLDSQGEDAP